MSAGVRRAGGRTRWSQVAERGSLLGLRLTVACYRRFGRPLSLVLVHAIVAYFFVTDRRGRAASRRYLERVRAVAGSDAVLGRRPGTWASFLHYRAFALSIFDRMLLWMGREGALSFEVRGLEPLRERVDQGRGALVVGAHLGSFDALRALAFRDRRPVNVLMYTRHAPRINRFFRELRPDVEVRVLDVSAGASSAALAIRERVARGELVAVLADRVEAGARGRSVRVRLLGGELDLPQFPFLLAALLGCPLAFMVALREGPGRYCVFTELLADRVELPREGREERVRALAQDYARRLERYVLRAPYQWFNFYDPWEDAGADRPAPTHRGEEST